MYNVMVVEDQAMPRQLFEAFIAMSDKYTLVHSIKNADMADASVYKITVETINSKGNASEDTYGGYAIKDVLKVAGCPDATKITAVANDGYEVEFELTDENAPYSLVAIEKNKEVGEDGTVFFAPCLSKTTGDYAKLVVELKAE